MTIEEVDALTGPLNRASAQRHLPTGRYCGAGCDGKRRQKPARAPRNPEEKAIFTLPEVVQRLIADGRLGEKTGAGFYRRQKTARLKP